MQSDCSRWLPQLQAQDCCKRFLAALNVWLSFVLFLSARLKFSQKQIPSCYCAGMLDLHWIHVDVSSMFLQNVSYNTLLQVTCALQPLKNCSVTHLLMSYSVYLFVVLLLVFLFPDLISNSLMRPVVLPYVEVWSIRTFTRLWLFSQFLKPVAVQFHTQAFFCKLHKISS